MVRRICPAEEEICYDEDISQCGGRAGLLIQGDNSLSEALLIVQIKCTFLCQFLNIIEYI